MRITGKLIADWMESNLVVPHGQGAGHPIKVLGWQRRFLGMAFRPPLRDVALSLGRGNGKTLICASIGMAALTGPLRVPNAETILVASSFQQARLLFDDVVSFLGPEANDRSKWQKWDSVGTAALKCKESGAKLRAIAGDPRRMHGIRPYLVLADEPAQWEPSKAEAALAALRTSMGKIAGSRMIVLGTAPASEEHWFARMLREPGSLVYAVPEGAKLFHKSTWKRANPSLDHMPVLLQRIRKEADQAKRDPIALASFKALRLNMGVSDVVESVICTVQAWLDCEGDVPREGPAFWGLDAGSSAAMSALAAYWPLTGRMETIAVFPRIPDLAQRGLQDGVGALYAKMHARAELYLAGERVSDLGALLRVGLAEYGTPLAIAVDRWREAEIRQVLDKVKFPAARLVCRGQGFKDGGLDMREYRAAIMSRQLRPVKSLLMRSAMAEARTVQDAAGNCKLAKATAGGRRARARDDAASAAILAVGAGERYRKSRASQAAPEPRLIPV